LRVVHLLYDITPVRCPHLCSPTLHSAFRQWLPMVLQQSDLVLTISEHSRQDLLSYTRERGCVGPPVEKIRLGDEPGAETSESAPIFPDWFRLPFVLFVSTIGLHKNQNLLLNVWRRLVKKHGNAIPPLVLVGGLGWGTADLLRELYQDETLAGHVLYLPHIRDQELRYLYRHCLFTLYPSHYEGWGLPVAESLVHGKLCITSSATSLPEVGGDLVEYHDPLDGVTCCRLVERAVFEPGWLAAREERIRRDFRPTPWRECAAQAWALIQKHLLPESVKLAA
jgi:glycosyltransferase involved in cell wall biosynthesis